jgi:outer membrane protein OmpA-like peptidoglycan-associated protein
MSNGIFSWRQGAAVTAIALLAGCANRPLATVASNPPPVPPAADATWYHIEFKTNSHALDDQGKLTVADVTNVLQHDPNAVATIIGKTDTVGSPDYNMHLSHMRADAVRDALVYQSHVAADRVETRWTGETRQRVASANDIPEEMNRVVDIAIH